MVYKIEKVLTKSPNKGSGCTQSITEEYHFIVPPEAPVYYPSPEEFKNPLQYIAKIRPEAESFGICKIKPPSDWQPPFAVDVDRLKFTPRIQRLNELEAKTRIKLNFLDQIAKFWELQGSSLKIPMVEKRALDLYALHTFVDVEGGFVSASTNRRWSKIACKMGYPYGKDLGSVLKHHYERILHPFDIFKQGKTLANLKSEDAESDTETDSKKKEKDYKPHGIVSRQAIKPPAEKYARRSKRCVDKNKEPKVVEPQPSPIKTVLKKEKDKVKEIKDMLNYEWDPLSKYVCHKCNRGDAEENMLLCDGCDDSYHTFCLMPPLQDIPKGDWRCPRCVAAEVSKPMEAFGFEQAKREYSLQQFGEMADQFKSDYFNMPVHMVPPSLIEKEFWRIVSSIDEDVTVEYGADLHTMDHGSGFPTKISLEEMATCEVEYAKSNWNLNNLPCLENSVFGHINADISGMKVPWMYVGMCFATFCWHNEDHWSYSINYLHWGEAKTWYGVPGHKAELFEGSMKKAAPELFESQPDLLHQLVTIMNPNILMEAGVPVCRTDQQAGEFVITFPRAYHAGFNQGYNFAEAVNFATADWLKIGRNCIDHYSMLRRYCVFSHDELVCKMASNPESLDHIVAMSAYEDMQMMVDCENKLRKSLLEWGVTEAEREAFELLPDDERQCEVCKTTCFLSAVTCSCSPEQLVCLKHCTELCKCVPEKHTLRYRYTLDELPVMLDKLKQRVNCYDEWIKQVEDTLNPQLEKTLTLNDLKTLLHTAQEKTFPSTSLLQSLTEAVKDAEKCAQVAQQLATKKLRTRTRQTAESKYKLTVEELTLFYEEISNLACVLKESDVIKELLDKVKEFQQEAKTLLDLETAESGALEKCIEAGVMLDVDLPELLILKQNLQRVTWLEEVADVKDDEDQVTLESLRNLLDTGVELPPHPMVEKEMADLQMLLMNVEKWEERAKECISNKVRQPMLVYENLLEEAEKIPAYLPTEAILKDSLKKAKDWISKVEAIETGPDCPYLDSVEQLVNKGNSIPIKLDLLTIFTNKLESAKTWKERTARTFLRKNSRYTLMEALSPRTEFGINVLKMKKKKFNEDGPPVICDVKLEGNMDAVEVVKAFKNAEKQEMSAMRDLRLSNLRKRATNNGDIRYCICRRGATGFMLQCELCKDWFHATCVPLPKNSGAKTKQTPAQQLAAAATKEVKFLCPCCLRSRRPRLETILSLLVSLQKLEVRLPEGEALQCLTERAMSWQDRARISLATDEIASALAKLSVLSQKLVEAAAREKTEKIISSELKKAANKIGDQELNRRVRAMSGVSSNEDSQSSQLHGFIAGEEAADNNHSQDSMSDTMSSLASPSYFSGNAEHAYSSLSKTNLIKQPKQPSLVLSEIARAELEELMLEGDLLEVSLDETLHIWRILQATKSKLEKDRYPPLEQLENEMLATKAEKDRHKARQRASRKRRLDEIDIQQLHKQQQQQQQQQMALKAKKHRLKQTPLPQISARPSMSPPMYSDVPSIMTLSSHNKTLPKKMLGKPKEIMRNWKGKPLKRQASMGSSSGSILEKKPERTVQKKKRKVQQDSSTESDSDENCAARKCLKPTGKEVDWVQCDGACEKWYHFRCLGLNKKDVNDDEDFICDNCRRRPNMRVQPSRHESREHTSRVKVEPTNMDENLGLHALLQLANQSTAISLDNNNQSWMHQQEGYNYDIPEMHRFHNLPSIPPARPNLTIAQPLQSSPDLLLNPISGTVQNNHSPAIPNYQLQDASIPNYAPAPIEHHPYHPTAAERKMMQGPPPPPPAPETYYNMPDSYNPYPHDTQPFPQNYPPPNYPDYVPAPTTSSYPQNYYAPPQTQYQQAYTNFTESYSTGPEPYTITQLSPTSLSKSNYTVQSYPPPEPTFSQPFPPENVYQETKSSGERTLEPKETTNEVPLKINVDLDTTPSVVGAPPETLLPQQEPANDGGENQ